MTGPPLTVGTGAGLVGDGVVAGVAVELAAVDLTTEPGLAADA